MTPPMSRLFRQILNQANVRFVFLSDLSYATWPIVADSFGRTSSDHLKNPAAVSIKCRLRIIGLGFQTTTAMPNIAR